MNYFEFNGVRSSDYGLIISSKDIYSAPASDVSFVSVPGRNGDVMIDNNRFLNVTVSYDFAFGNVKNAVLKLVQEVISTEDNHTKQVIDIRKSSDSN